MEYQNIVWLIPALPLLGFIIISLFGDKLGKTMVGLIGPGVILGAFILVCLLLNGVLGGRLGDGQVYSYFDWIAAGKLTISLGFLIDPLSIWFLMIITGIGFLIHVYSVGYMHDDEAFARFFAYLNLFIFSMLMLVMGSNYILMFLGWEGVGFCSYGLIGFWYKKQDYNAAAQKAFVMNRIGDLGLLLGILLIFINLDTLNFQEINALIGNGAHSSIKPGSGLAVIITLLLFVGATGKSAQIPLYTWLPDAMAGPTPVSALIHAATMVTAGIYMIIRSNALFNLAPLTQEIILGIAVATTIISATIAIAQKDIKKVLAYSTVSHLGIMFIALGMGCYTSALFHVTTHAFFKALLFLGAGSVIHALHHEQDIRNMGGLRKYLPITFATFLIGILAAAGVVPFAGFFSKDEIIGRMIEHSMIMAVFAYAITILSALYSFRLLWLVFFGDFRGTEHQRSHLHESPLSMTLPLIILAVLAVVGGLLNLPHTFGGHSMLEHFFHEHHVLFKEPAAIAFSASTEWILYAVATAIIAAIAIITYSYYIGKKNAPAADGQEAGLTKVLYNKYYVDEIYAALFVKPVDWLSVQVHKIIELKVVDGIVNLVARSTTEGGKVLRLAQSGSVSFYLFVMVIGIITILFFNSIYPK